MKRTAEVVGEFYRPRDGNVIGAVAGVVRAVDWKAVDEQVAPGGRGSCFWSCAGP